MAQLELVRDLDYLYGPLTGEQARFAVALCEWGWIASQKYPAWDQNRAASRLVRLIGELGSVQRNSYCA